MVLAREKYYKEISDKLAWLQGSIEHRASSNLHDSSLFAEDFVNELLNIVFDLRLKNLNRISSNEKAIDLGDTFNKVAVQVTATTTRKKIKETIQKFITYKYYERYSKLYIFVLKPKQTKYKKFDTQDFFVFNENDDILDFKLFLKMHIQSLEIEKLERVYNFINQELTSGSDIIFKYSDKITYESDNLHNWKSLFSLIYYVNFDRLIFIASSVGFVYPNINSNKLNGISSLIALPRNDYSQIISFTRELLEHWRPNALSLQDHGNINSNFIGCTFSFFHTEFKSKNLKYWNGINDDEKPRMTGLYKKDPHLFLELGDVKIYLPLNLGWITTDTSYHNFGLDDTGIASSLSGLCILKSISKQKDAVFTPIVIGAYSIMEQFTLIASGRGSEADLETFRLFSLMK